MSAYAEAMAATSREHAPWYVIPADRKWYARALVAEIVVKTLEDLDLAYPKLTKTRKLELARARRRLVNEG
jgi:hypothetical protein